MRKDRQPFTTIRIQGALLPPDFLQRVAARDPELKQIAPKAYHLAKGATINEAITDAWQRAQKLWSRFAPFLAELDGGHRGDAAGTSETRDRWLLPLLQELAFGRVQAAQLDVDGERWPVSHAWNHVPLHLIGAGLPLDQRTKGQKGAASRSPHALVQEFLNRSDDHLWGVVSNGRQLRILRDNASLTRQAFVEFDLQAMMEGEVYADFVLFWLLLHQSSFEADRPERCRLERWSQQAQQDGKRVLDGLRRSVESAIVALGAGFLAHRRNAALREALQQGRLTKEDYYRQLLRLAYRLIFLFVAEDRDLLLDPHAPDDAKRRYRDHYATTRMRTLAGRRRGGRHGDLWQALRLVMGFLGRDEGCPELALPALGSFLWSDAACPALDACELENRALLEAFHHLAYLVDQGVRRPVDWRNLGSEELGSVYESLLELHPEIDTGSGHFDLKTAGGSERKTTGSYYTPASLIACLLDTALDPVVDEALRGKHGAEAERALLELKVCDPACGSGHFLVAAAHRLAKRLAAIRTEEQEPGPDALHKALRDVVGRCLYGVDKNPLAVELCKVSLWMEAIEPGKPLSFLDAKIQCGNSLLGATPALLARGIPDDAFQPLTGDDKKICAGLRKENKAERAQGGLFAAEGSTEYASLTTRMRELERLDDRTIRDLHEKERRHRLLVDSPAYQHAKLIADAWCAAFVWPKHVGAPDPIREELFRELRSGNQTLDVRVRQTVDDLAAQYQFFHWHLAFPDVFEVPEDAVPNDADSTGWEGGFSVVLGNPPWDTVELKEREWFASRDESIATAGTGAKRKAAITAIEESDPELHTAYLRALRAVDGERHLLRSSGRFPLCGRGRVNTYAVFAETNRLIASQLGRVGCIVPSGIATDDTTKAFFDDLTSSGQLVSLYDFENRSGIFPGVHRSYKFCLLTIGASSGTQADFLFFAHDVEDLTDPDRHFTLSAEDITLLNPNTRTCPIFRRRKDAEITKEVYRRISVLLKEGPPEVNPWDITFRQGLFNMTSDSHLFRTKDVLEREGFQLTGNRFERDGETWLPLYEAKMLHHFTHRYGDYADYPPGAQTTALPDVPIERLENPAYQPLPRYWVPAPEVASRLRDRWPHAWLLGWRDICRNTDERTVIAAVLPRVGIGHKFPLFLPGESDPKLVAGLIANLSSFAFDYIARQKIGGTSLTYFYLKQLPVLPPETYAQDCPWDPGTPLHAWLLPRVLELTYTAWDLESFARDCGYDGPPFRWDEARRFHLRAELDAAFFHLYGLDRDDTAYILDTFPIVKRKDEKVHGCYRTKDAILEIYDALAAASAASISYATSLVPPAADARCGHPPLDGGTR